MRKRDVLLGAAAGVSLGYAFCRAVEALVPPAPLPAQRRTAERYGRTRRLLTSAGLVKSLADAALTAYGPLAAAVDRRTAPLPRWLRPAARTAAFALIAAPGDLATAYGEGRRLEERYGLTEQSFAGWLGDWMKAFALETLVGALLTIPLDAAVRRFPRAWPWLATAAAPPLLAAANVAVPLYVLPLFNRYEPLHGELEAPLRTLAIRCGAGDAELLRMDMSRQTKKANAFVVGVGATKRIVVGDTLIEHFTRDETLFVVAHELGHYVHRDTWRSVIAGSLGAAALFFGAAAFRPRTAAQLQWWMTLLGTPLRPALAAYSRSREWAADRFAVETTGAPGDGAAAFRRLREQNLAEDEQPGWYEFLFSTHPSLKKRIAALETAVTPPSERN